MSGFLAGTYPEPIFIDDEFDLTPFKGEQLLLRFSYSTDPGLVKKGWFIDDVEITADGASVYRSDFESSDETTRLFPMGWTRISSADGGDSDHAYYVEVRDRVGFDKDGKGQSERGAPTWQPGLAILYTDENHGYGNVGASDPPAQTIVDSKPQPGNNTPNLDDAAFTAAPGRDKFDGCTHIDNYKNPGGADGLWKLPNGLAATVTNLSGLSSDGVTSAAAASLIVDVKPDCSLVFAPPVLSFGQGHEDPDADGSFELVWQRPAGAVGPDQLQEATLLAALASDDAEGGTGQWDVATEGAGAFAWEPSSLKRHSGESAFWARAAEGATNASSTLALRQPLAIPGAGTTVLSFWDWFMNEGDDRVAVNVSEDGLTWATVYEASRSALAPDAALAFESEPMTEQRVDLAAYKGKSIKLRFRYSVGPDNRAGSTPFGWYVDDIGVETANWYDIANTTATSFVRSGLTSGTYHYRVRTSFPTGPVTVAGPWSNVISTRVEKEPGPVSKPDLQVSKVEAINHKGKAAERVTLTATITNAGDAGAGASKTEFVLDGATVLGLVDTPLLAPGGSVEVSVQWDTRGAKGEHTVVVTADKTGLVAESAEANNTASATFNVKGNKVSNP